MHRLNAKLLDVSYAFQNKNASIHERFCVSPPTFYLDWFQRSYPNVLLNRDEIPFSIQCMNGIQGTKPSKRQWNRLLDAVATILKYIINPIDHAIYIKVLSDGS